MQRHVLRYLLDHRDAKDTADGIMQWWLVGEQTAVRPSDVNSALDDLVARGWVTATSLGRGAVLYGLDKTRLADVQTFMDGNQEPE